MNNLKDISIDELLASVNNNKVNDPSLVQQAGDILKEGARYAGGALARGAALPLMIPEIPARVAGGIAKMAGVETSGRPFLSDRLIKKAEDLGANVAPKGLIAESVQDVLSTLPLDIATGGSITGAKLLGSLAGSMGFNVAREAGLPLPAQFATSLLAQRGFNKVASRINKIAPDGKLKDFANENASAIEKAKKTAYGEKDILGADVKAKSRPVVETLNKYKGLSKKQSLFDIADVKETNADIDKVLGLFDTPWTTGEKIYKAKEMVNAFLQKPNLSTPRQQFYKKISGSLKDVLAEAGKDHPKFNEAWQFADELHTLQNWQSPMRSWLQQNISDGKIGKFIKNPTAQRAAFMLSGLARYGLGGNAGLAGGLAAAGLGLDKAAGTAWRAKSFNDYLQKSDRGRKVLWDIKTAAASDSANAIAKSMTKLDRMANEFDSDKPMGTLRDVSIQDLIK